jgi:hypothetical protein
MPELIDKPRAEKFSYPGLQDRSQPIVQPSMNYAPVPETQESVADVKATRKKKDAPAPTPVGRKPLKLGKAKG